MNEQKYFQQFAGETREEINAKTYWVYTLVKEYGEDRADRCLGSGLTYEQAKALCDIQAKKTAVVMTSNFELLRFRGEFILPRCKRTIV